MNSVWNLVGFKDLKDNMYLRWLKESFVVVVFDTVYSTETILAKVRSGLKDTSECVVKARIYHPCKNCSFMCKDIN